MRFQCRGKHEPTWLSGWAARRTDHALGYVTFACLAVLIMIDSVAARSFLRRKGANYALRERFSPVAWGGWFAANKVTARAECPHYHEDLADNKEIL